MKEPIKFGIILLLFCAASAGLLAYVNGITEPKIKQMEFEQTMESYQAIFGEAADDFEEYDKAKLESIKENYPDIQNVFVAKRRRSSRIWYKRKHQWIWWIYDKCHRISTRRR